MIPSAGDWALPLEAIFLDYQNDRIHLDRKEETIEAFSWESVSKKWQRLIVEA